MKLVQDPWGDTSGTGLAWVLIVVETTSGRKGDWLFEGRVRKTKFAKRRCYFLGVASRFDGTNRLGSLKADKTKEQDKSQNLGSKTSETDVASSSRFRY